MSKKEPSFPKFPEVEPDEWDLEMIRLAEEDNDDDFITLEEFAKKLGIYFDSL